MGIFNRYKIQNEITEKDASVKIDSNLKLVRHEYIRLMVENTYKRILFDVFNHVGEKRDLGFAYDVFNPKNDGLISIIAKNMAHETKNAYLIERSNGNITFKKTGLINDLDVTNTIIIDFSCYDQTKLLRDVFSIDFDNWLALESSIKSNKALLVKIQDLNQIMIASNNKKQADLIQDQVNDMTDALRTGGVGVVGVGSGVERPTVDVSSNTQAKDALNERLSTITGYPSMFFDGQQASTLSDTGGSVSDATENARALYFHSIIAPIFGLVYGKPISLMPELELSQISQGISLIEISEALSDSAKDKILGLIGFEKGDLNG